MRGTGATRRNSRCVALAVGVVTGFVDGDFDVQVLLSEYGECGSRRGAVEDGMADHGHRLFRCGWRNALLTVPRRVIYSEG